MVTSPHTAASETGLAVLACGGNAIEAAVAMGAVLAVAYPHFCGLGGDAVWMIADRDGRATCLLGIGQASAAPPAPGPIPLRGAGSALTSAGLVDSWGHALDLSRRHWGGRIALSQLLEDAIALASDGFDVTPSQAFWHRLRGAEIADWPGFAALFGAAGAAPARLCQPQLAASLTAIAKDGARSFYEGDLGRRIVEGLAFAGSPIDADDLRATRTRQSAPLSLDYRGTRLLGPPPPTQGATTLAIMGILAEFAMGDLDPHGPEFTHLCVEAVKQAFLDRGAIADPDFSDKPLDLKLDAASLKQKAASIDRDRALPWPAVFQTGDTVFLAASDAAGCSVSLLQSLYFDWGSGVVAGDTGILWQNRGAAFDRSAAGPNRWQPGKRPFYTLNPGIALRGGKPFLLYGTQGADGQPQTLATLLSRCLDHGLDPLAALRAPRFLLGRTFSDSRDTLKLEASAGGGVFAALGQRGHEMSQIPAFSPLAGQAGLIRIDPDGAMTGAHDPRGDGSALGLAASPESC